MTVATKFTLKKRKKFLLALEDTGNVTEAATQVGITRQTVYGARRRDPAFAKLMEESAGVAADRLEREAFRRACEGWDEPVHYQGLPTSIVRKYSDTLLIFLLKGARPEKYRERYDVKSKGEVVIHKAEDLSDDALAAIVAKK